MKKRFSIVIAEDHNNKEVADLLCISLEAEDKHPQHHRPALC